MQKYVDQKCSTTCNKPSHQQDNEEKDSIAEDNNDPVAYAEFMSANGWEEIPQDNFTVLAISQTTAIQNPMSMQEADLNKHIVKLKTKSEDLFAIADSGNPMPFLNKKTAERLRQNDRSAKFKLNPGADDARNIVCCNGKYIVPNRRLIIAVESGQWIIQSAPFIIVDDQKANIIGRNVLPKIGINLVQDKPKHNQILNINGKTKQQKTT